MAQKFKLFGREFRLSWNEVIVCAAMILLGLILIIWPGVAVGLVVGGVGGVSIIIGIVHLVRYSKLDVRASISSNELAVGLIWLVGGILIIALHRFLLSAVPVFFGIILLIGGIGKVQSTLQLKRMGARRWYFELVCTCLSIGFGAIILANPFSTALLLMRIIGVALLIEGAQDLVSRYAYKKTSEIYFAEFRDDEL